MNKLQKIEIPRGISVKEKTVWIFKLYGVCYICHLFCCNNEDRLILYNTSKSEKVQVEDAFFILGKPGEAYAVNTVDNLVMVHFMNSKVGNKGVLASKRNKQPSSLIMAGFEPFFL